MAGRKRKQGKRSPKTGRLIQPHKQARELDEQRGNLVKRCQALGITPTDENLIAVRDPMAACEAGRAIWRYTRDPEERRTLFEAVTHVRRVTVAYDAACAAPRRHAVCLRLLLPLDPLTISADDPPPVDDRPEVERYLAAVTAWTRLHGWLMHSDPLARSQVWLCIEDAPVKDMPAMMRGLMCIRDGLAGRAVHVRTDPRHRGIGALIRVGGGGRC